jgi:hypothetical protein
MRRGKSKLMERVGDNLMAEQIICECRRLKGLILINKGTHRAQRYVSYGLPAQAIISRKWRLTE